VEYVKIPRVEYELLLKYRDVVNYFEETVHEELNVKPLKDKKAIKVMSTLEKERKEGKRRTVSDEEFTKKHQDILE
jgi:hypothetical protein